MLDKLHAVGYRTNRGIKDAGILLILKQKGGGHYFGVSRSSRSLCLLLDSVVDTGACQLIIDGKIKLKNDSQIAGFDEKGIKFENGSRLDADVVVCATGCVMACFIVYPV